MTRRTPRRPTENIAMSASRAVARLGFARRSRDLDFTLDEVRTLLALASGGQASCAEARTLASAHLNDVRARIADLRRMERVPAGAVKACDAGANTNCPLLDSLRRKKDAHREK